MAKRTMTPEATMLNQKMNLYKLMTDLVNIICENNALTQGDVMDILQAEAYRTESRPGERLAILLSRPLGALMIEPLSKYRAIDSRDVACAMIAAARKDGTAYVVLESNEISSLAAAVRPKRPE